RRDRFVYENDSVRYCATDEANMLNCLSPSTSLNVTSVPPNRSPPLVTPIATGGRPSRNSFSNVPFLWIFARTRVCDEGGVKSIGGASGDPKSDVATVCSGSSRGSVWIPYSPL